MVLNFDQKLNNNIPSKTTHFTKITENLQKKSTSYFKADIKNKHDEWPHLPSSYMNKRGL